MRLVFYECSVLSNKEKIYHIVIKSYFIFRKIIDVDTKNFQVDKMARKRKRHRNLQQSNFD